MNKEFGGPWTELKLSVLKKYLVAYTVALKNKPFRKVYIDSFAGNGMIQTKTGQQYEGSAKIALNVEGFDEYLFIEKDQDNVSALHTMGQAYPTKMIRYWSGDANDLIGNWVTGLEDIRGVRGVAFFDPFGMELAWETLANVVRTGVLDVWYWFPLSGLYRQTPRTRR